MHTANGSVRIFAVAAFFIALCTVSFLFSSRFVHADKDSGSVSADAECKSGDYTCNYKQGASKTKPGQQCREDTPCSSTGGNASGVCIAAQACKATQVKTTTGSETAPEKASPTEQGATPTATPPSPGSAPAPATPAPETPAPTPSPTPAPTPATTQQQQTAQQLQQMANQSLLQSLINPTPAAQQTGQLVPNTGNATLNDLSPAQAIPQGSITPQVPTDISQGSFQLPTNAELGEQDRVDTAGTFQPSAQPLVPESPSTWDRFAGAVSSDWNTVTAAVGNYAASLSDSINVTEGGSTPVESNATVPDTAPAINPEQTIDQITAAGRLADAQSNITARDGDLSTAEGERVTADVALANAKDTLTAAQSSGDAAAIRQATDNYNQAVTTYNQTVAANIQAIGAYNQALTDAKDAFTNTLQVAGTNPQNFATLGQQLQIANDTAQRNLSVTQEQFSSNQLNCFGDSCTPVTQADVDAAQAKADAAKTNLDAYVAFAKGETAALPDNLAQVLDKANAPQGTVDSTLRGTASTLNNFAGQLFPNATDMNGLTTLGRMEYLAGSVPSMILGVGVSTIAAIPNAVAAGGEALGIPGFQPDAATSIGCDINASSCNFNRGLDIGNGVLAAPLAGSIARAGFETVGGIASAFNDAMGGLRAAESEIAGLGQPVAPGFGTVPNDIDMTLNPATGKFEMAPYTAETSAPAGLLTAPPAALESTASELGARLSLPEVASGEAGSIASEVGPAVNTAEPSLNQVVADGTTKLDELDQRLNAILNKDTSVDVSTQVTALEQRVQDLKTNMAAYEANPPTISTAPVVEDSSQRLEAFANRIQNLNTQLADIEQGPLFNPAQVTPTNITPQLNAMSDQIASLSSRLNAAERDLFGTSLLEAPPSQIHFDIAQGGQMVLYEPATASLGGLPGASAPSSLESAFGAAGSFSPTPSLASSVTSLFSNLGNAIASIFSSPANANPAPAPENITAPALEQSAPVVTPNTTPIATSPEPTPATSNPALGNLPSTPSPSLAPAPAQSPAPVSLARQVTQVLTGAALSLTVAQPLANDVSNMLGGWAANTISSSAQAAPITANASVPAMQQQLQAAITHANELSATAKQTQTKEDGQAAVRASGNVIQTVKQIAESPQISPTDAKSLKAAAATASALQDNMAAELNNIMTVWANFPGTTQQFKAHMEAEGTQLSNQTNALAKQANQALANAQTATPAITTVGVRPPANGAPPHASITPTGLGTPTQVNVPVQVNTRVPIVQQGPIAAVPRPLPLPTMNPPAPYSFPPLAAPATSNYTTQNVTLVGDSNAQGVAGCSSPNLQACSTQPTRFSRTTAVSGVQISALPQQINSLPRGTKIAIVAGANDAGNSADIVRSSVQAVINAANNRGVTIVAWAGPPSDAGSPALNLQLAVVNNAIKSALPSSIPYVDLYSNENIPASARSGYHLTPQGYQLAGQAILAKANSAPAALVPVPAIPPAIVTQNIQRPFALAGLPGGSYTVYIPADANINAPDFRTVVYLWGNDTNVAAGAQGKIQQIVGQFERQNVAVIIPDIGSTPGAAGGSTFTVNNGAVAKALLSSAFANIDSLSGSTRNLSQVPMVAVFFSGGGTSIGQGFLTSGAADAQLNLKGGGIINLGGQYAPATYANWASAHPNAFMVSVSTQTDSTGVGGTNNGNDAIARALGVNPTGALTTSPIPAGGKVIVDAGSSLSHSTLPSAGLIKTAMADTQGLANNGSVATAARTPPALVLPANPGSINSVTDRAAVAQQTYQLIRTQGIRPSDLVLGSPNYGVAWKGVIDTTRQVLNSRGMLNSQLDAPSVLALARQETGIPGQISEFQSPTGVRGLMQVTGGSAIDTLGQGSFSTWQGTWDTKSFAREDHIGSVITGMVNFDQLLYQYGGNISAAAQTYNSGSPNGCAGAGCVNGVPTYGPAVARDTIVMRNAQAIGKGDPVVVAQNLGGLATNRSTTPQALTALASVLSGSQTALVPCEFKGCAATPTIQPGNSGYVSSIARVQQAPASGLFFQDPQTGVIGVPSNPSMSKDQFLLAARQDVAIERLVQSRKLTADQAKQSSYQTFTATPSGNAPQQMNPQQVQKMIDDYLYSHVNKNDLSTTAQAATHAAMPIEQYMIGGMDPNFRINLYYAGQAMDKAGVTWSITNAYRDNYNQSIIPGCGGGTFACAPPGGSMHGNTPATAGYGHGLAVDISGPGQQWLLQNGQQYGIGHPYLMAKDGSGRTADAPHFTPTNSSEYIRQKGQPSINYQSVLAQQQAELSKSTTNTPTYTITDKDGNVVARNVPLPDGAFSGGSGGGGGGGGGAGGGGGGGGGAGAGPESISGGGKGLGIAGALVGGGTLTVVLLADKDGHPLGQDGQPLKDGGTPLSISSDATLPKATPDPTNPNQLNFPDDRPQQPNPPQNPGGSRNPGSGGNPQQQPQQQQPQQQPQAQPQKPPQAQPQAQPQPQPQPQPFVPPQPPVPTTTTTPLPPQLVCTPTNAIVGTTTIVTVKYSCASGVASSTAFSSGGSPWGTAHVPIRPNSAGSAQFPVSCVLANLQSASTMCTIKVTKPSVTLIANPSSVAQGSAVTLGWTSVSTTACKVTDANGMQIGLTATTGTAVTSALEASTVFHALCQTSAGTSVSASANVTVH
jgi:hypothetical protein